MTSVSFAPTRKAFFCTIQTSSVSGLNNSMRTVPLIPFSVKFINDAVIETSSPFLTKRGKFG